MARNFLGLGLKAATHCLGPARPEVCSAGRGQPLNRGFLHGLDVSARDAEPLCDLIERPRLSTVESESKKHHLAFVRFESSEKSIQFAWRP